MNWTWEDTKKLLGVLLAVLLFVAAQYGIIVPAIENAVQAGQNNFGVRSTSLWTADRSGTTITGASGGKFVLNSGAALIATPGATVYLPYSSISTPTPNVNFGATPAAAKWQCKQVNIIGSATVTAPGVTTPRAVTHGIAGDPGGNVDVVSHVNASGVITVSTWRIVANTPVAATTSVPIDVCIIGQ